MQVDEGDGLAQGTEGHVSNPDSFCTQLIFNDHVNRYRKRLQFSTLNSQDVVKISEFQVTHRDLYTATDRVPVKDGVLDRRLVRPIHLLVW